MYSPIWTPDALRSELTAFEGRVWRIVEAQNRFSTMKVVPNLSKQSSLERVLDEAKPKVPANCQHLDYLLSTPFRYDATYPRGSRFRRAGRSLGVYYSSADIWSAVAEIVFYRLLLYADSPDIELPVNPVEFTAIEARLMTSRALPLDSPFFDGAREQISHLSNYGDCQALVDVARDAGAEVILHRSVRDPHHGMNVALLNPIAFAEPKPTAFATIRLHFNRDSVRAVREFPFEAREFQISDFAADTRIAPLINR